MITTPIFIREINEVGSVYQSGNAGTKTWTLSSAANFSVGDYVVSYHANGLNACFLGRVTKVVGSAVTTQFGLTNATAGTTKLIVVWSDNSGRQTSIGGNRWKLTSKPGLDGFERSRTSGIESLDLLGDQPVYTKSGAGRDYMELVFADSGWQDYRAFERFLRVGVEDGLRSFYCCYFDRDEGAAKVDLVKLRDPGRERTRTIVANVLRSWSVGLVVIKSGVLRLD